MAGTLFLYPEDCRLGAFQIVASIKVPQRFNVERSPEKIGIDCRQCRPT